MRKQRPTFLGGDSTTRRLRSEPGMVMALSALLFGALFFVVVMTVQYLNGVRESIATYRLVTMTSQQMRLGAPYKAGSLRLGMWTARLLGFPSAQAIEGIQSYPGIGSINMGFDSSIHPPRVSVSASKTLNLLAGFMSNFSAGIGLTALSTQAEISATSYESWVSVATDTSLSMIGNGTVQNGQPSRFSKLLEAFNVPEDVTSTGAECYPIKISDWANFVPAYREALKKNQTPTGKSYYEFYTGLDPDKYNPTQSELKRFVCNIRRQLLPLFVAERARPMQLRYDMERPEISAAVTDPAFGSVPNVGQWYTTYNPGVSYKYTYWKPDLAAVPPDPHKLPGDNMLVCSKPDPRDPVTCLPDTGTTGSNPHCFPFPTTNRQFTINRAAARGPFTDFVMGAPTCKLSGVGDSDYDQVGCSPSWIKYTDNDFCWRPWGGGNLSFDFTPEELNICSSGGGSQPNPEMYQGGGCPTQYNQLDTHFSDLWVLYKRLTQAFVIGLSDAVTLIDFFTVAAPTEYGNVSNPVSNPNSQWGISRALGIRHLYSSLKMLQAGQTGHIYRDSIDSDLSDLSVSTLIGNNGNPYYLYNFAYFPGMARQNEMIPHLDPTRWPNTNPQSRAGLTVTDEGKLLPSGSTFYGREYLAPVEHPLYPFASGNYPYGVPLGRCGTWEAKSPGKKPTEHTNVKYNFTTYGDTEANINANRWVPLPGLTVEDAPLPVNLNGSPAGGLTSISPYHSTYYPLSGAFPGILDWPPLLSVYYSGSNQGKLVKPYQPYAPEDIRNLAMCAFNYMAASPGGTDIWGATQAARKQFEEVRLPTNFPKASGAAVFITDGEPNLGMSNPWPVAQLNADVIPTGPVTDPNSHLGKIKAELDTLNASPLKAFAILLFIKREPVLNQNAQDFISLFDNSIYPKRISFVIDVSTAQDFAQQFAHALSLIRLFILGATKFVPHD